MIKTMKTARASFHLGVWTPFNHSFVEEKLHFNESVNKSLIINYIKEYIFKNIKIFFYIINGN